MSSIASEVIDVLVRLGLVQGRSGGGVEPSVNLPLDESGNIIANVNHRTGVIGHPWASQTGLIALAGGLGEISVATDEDALIVHKGVANQAKAFWRSPVIGHLATLWEGTGTETTGVASSAAGAGGSVAALPSGLVYGGSTVPELTNNTVSLPWVDSNVPCMIDAHGTAIFAASGGTHRTVALQVDAGGTGHMDEGAWETRDTFTLAASAANTKVHFHLCASGQTNTATFPSKFRFIVRQDSGGASGVTIDRLAITVSRTDGYAA